MKKHYFLMALALLLSFTVRAAVVIQEVYGGGGNTGAPYNRDYIMLFNNGTTAVDLAGYSVQYAAATSTSYTVVPLSGTIQPNGYFLVAMGPTGTTGSALPTPDVNGPAGTNLSASNGKVALANTTTAVTGPGSANVVDFLGYGTANQSEGGTAAAARNNTTAIARTATGVDTNDNASDFSNPAPNPRNTAAAPLPVSYYAFSASRQGNGRVVLEWATAAEQQNAYFEVQRSTDAQVFEAIGRVASQGGNSIRRQAYGFTDAAAPAGLTLYYRLQQFDTDGTTSLSRVMAVAAGWQQALGVYPNPATDLLALDLPAGKPQGVVVRSLSGVEMSRFGSGQPVRVGQLAPGVYLLEVQTADGQRASVRFVKQ